VFRVTAVAAGTQLGLTGGAGIDVLLIGDLSITASNIFGPITFDTGADAGRVQVADGNSTAGKVAHLDLNSLGAYAGDTLFGPGGSLHFTTLVNQLSGFNFDAMSLLLGSGADTIYAQPFASGTVGIEGANPTTSPGDTLRLALATAANYVVHGTPASGSVTSSNLQTLSYTNFETGPIIDDVAPFIVAQSYDGTGVPTILVEFSEDVSNALSVSYLELINTTTSEQVPYAYLDLAYDAGTNTASFTFPGYTDGILPPGEYTAKIYGSLPDFFGNVLGVESPFSFTVAAPPPQLLGDYNRNNEVDAADYVLWRKTLDTIVTIPYAGADGDGNLVINQDDYGVWRMHFGQTLPPPGAGNIAIASAVLVAPVNKFSVAVVPSRNSADEPKHVSEQLGPSGAEQVASRRQTAPAVLAVAASTFTNHRPAGRGAIDVQRTLAVSRFDDALLAWLEPQSNTNKPFEDFDAIESWASKDLNDTGDAHLNSLEKVFAELLNS
jgi:hypothetical protein